MFYVSSFKQPPAKYLQPKYDVILQLELWETSKCFVLMAYRKLLCAGREEEKEVWTCICILLYLVQCVTSVFNVRTVITGTWIKAGGPMINEIEGPSPYLRSRYTT